MFSKIIPFLLGVGKFARIAIALCFTILSLSCLVIVLVSGLRTSFGKLDQLSFAVINSSKVEVHIEGTTYRGLPDANDFLKYKDFYAFYLWNYCSGKVHNGSYYVDFCSEPRQSLYHLFRFWKVWGASVHKEGIRFYWLEKGPRLLYISYLVAGSMKTLEFLTSIPSLFTNRVSRVLVVISAVASACLLTTSIIAQVTYGQLISRADDEDIPITAQKIGQILYVANWVGTVCSLFGLGIWYHIWSSNAVKRAPTIDTTSYPRARTSGAESPIQPRQAPPRMRNFSKSS